ncbi:hypothetical protein HDV01_001596 [Terramyces sp. JEL0728]|nr:hypothetical protein HDV01_001596 [Terramyces sp. JEL0728]
MEETIMRANSKTGLPINVGVVSLDLEASSKFEHHVFISALCKTVVDHPHLVYGNASSVLVAKKVEDLPLEYKIQDAAKAFSMETLVREELNEKVQSRLGWRLRVIQGKMWVKENLQVITLYVSLTSEFQLLDEFSTSFILKQFLANLALSSRGQLDFGSLRESIVTLPAIITQPTNQKTFNLNNFVFSLWLVYQHFQKSAKTVFYGRPRTETATLESFEMSDVKTECKLIALTPKELNAIREEVKNTNSSTTAYLLVVLLASYRGMINTLTKKTEKVQPSSFASLFKIIPIAFMVALCAEFGMESTAWFTCSVIMMVFFYFPKLLKEPRVPNYQNYTVVLDKRKALGNSKNSLGNCSVIFSEFMYKLSNRNHFWDKVAAMTKHIDKCRDSISLYEGLFQLLPAWLIDEYIHRASPNLRRDYSLLLSYLGEPDWSKQIPVNDYFFGTNSTWIGNRHVMQLSGCVFENRMNILITYPSKLVESYQIDIFVDSLRQVINNSIYDQKISVGDTLDKLNKLV